MKTETSKILSDLDAALSRAALPYQKKIENRAKELCKIIREAFGPLHLSQGMGSWSLTGDGEVPAIYSDDSTGTISVFDFASRHDTPENSRRCCETPQVSERVMQALWELAELCEFVNDPANPLSPFDLDIS